MARIRLSVALAALLLVALLVSTLVRPQQASEQAAGCAAVGKIGGWITVGVGNASSTVEMHSFRLSFFTALLPALFPVRGTRTSIYTLPGAATPTGECHGFLGYGDVKAAYSVWGMNVSVTPIAVTGGVSVPLTWWRIYYNDSGIFLLVSGNATANLDWMIFGTGDSIGLYRWLASCGPMAIASDKAPLLPYSFQYEGQPAWVTYTFFFPKSVFTENFVRLFVAFLYNSAAGRVPVTATDGSSVLVDPYTPDPWRAPASNVPVDTYIVLGDGQAQYSPFAYRVQHEIARAKPAVLTVGSARTWPTSTTIALSYVFVFDRDTTVTEAAVYSKLTNGKEVMLLYYVFPRPVKVKAGQPFPVAFALFAPTVGIP